MEGVSQEWRVGSELETEGQSLTEVLLNLLLRCEMKRAIGSGNLYLRHTVHWLYILESADSMKGVPGLLSCHNPLDSMLILIQQTRGQEFLLEELCPELKGFGLEVLVLFCGHFKVEESSFNGDQEGITYLTMVG